MSGLLLCLGCPTGYESGAEWGFGYDHEKIRHNAYAIYYVGNAFTSFERASDFSRLRAAEIALEHGYNYFLPIDAVKREQGDRVYTPYGPVSAHFPVSGILVLCFRDEPVHLEDYYEAGRTFDELVRKYKLMKNNQYIKPKIGPFVPEPNEIEFEMIPAIKTELMPVEQVRIIFGVRDFYHEGFRIGRYTDIENPMGSFADFAEHVRPIAAEHGANGVLIEDQWREIRDNPFYFKDIDSELISFVADLYVLPPACLGIVWEPGDLSNGKHVIRKFIDRSKGPQAGLKIGDRVLEINDVDMLDQNGLIELFSQWSPGDIATLAVVRDGQEISIEVPLVSNF
jgi:hypothetical protein